MTGGSDVHHGDRAASPRREFLLVAGVALLLTIFLLIGTDLMTYGHPDFAEAWDHHHYLQMATGNPLDFHYSPYCWRVGVPLLTKALPLDVQTSFLLIAIVSVWMGGVAVYYLARRFRFSHTHALIGLIMFFSLDWGPKFVLYDFWLPDALGFLLLVLLVDCAAGGKAVQFGALLALGATVKESTLFAAPLYYSLGARRAFDGRLALRLMLVVLPAVAVLIGVRSVIPQMGGSYDYGQLFREIGLPRLTDLSLRTVYRYTIGTFGVMVGGLALLSLRRHAVVLLRLAPFLVLVYLQPLFAVNEERLLIAAFPAMIVLALYGIEVASQALGVKAGHFVALPVLFFALTLMGIGSNKMVFLVQLVVFVAYVAVVALYGRRAARLVV